MVEKVPRQGRGLTHKLRARLGRIAPARGDATGRLLERLRQPPLSPWADLNGQPRVAIGGGRSWHAAGHHLRVPDPAAGTVGIHAVTVGQGPHLLLLHGFVQASWAWRHNLDALAEHFTVHAVCVPGFGWSDKPKICDFHLVEQARRILVWMDCMAIQRAHLVGNSLGAALALQIAALAADRVAHLVLVNPAGAGSYPMAWLARLQRPAWAPLLALPGIPFGLKLGLRYGAYAQLPVDDAYMAHFLAPLGTAGAPAAALAVARHYNADLAALDRRLRGILHPTLVIRGGADRVIPEAIVWRVANGLHDARVERFDASGHCPMEEEPARFNRVLLNFLLNPQSPLG